MRFEDVAVAMKETSGTVVFNSAGGFIPKLAQVCLAAVKVFDMPCALNMYLTNPGQKTSAPPHTDKQVYETACDVMHTRVRPSYSRVRSVFRSL